MPTNFYMYFVAALIPMIVGALYYSPAVAGKAWMKSNGFTDEDLKGGNMALIMALAYFLSLMLCFFYTTMVVHQTNIFGLLMPDVQEAGSAAAADFKMLIAKYGDRHRSFGHGAAHGMLTAVFLVLPILGIVSLFEQRGWKYLLIHWIYWSIVLILVGGVLCATLHFPHM